MLQPLTKAEAQALEQLAARPEFIRVRGWLERSREQLHTQLERRADERTSAGALTLAEVLKECREAPDTCQRFANHTDLRGAGGQSPDSTM